MKKPIRHNGRSVDENYKLWRLAIYSRDEFKCQWPGCQSKRRINAHHIKRWSDYPGLRFNTNNGITLCERHHKSIAGLEDNYAPMFYQIIVARTMSERSRKDHEK